MANCPQPRSVPDVHSKFNNDWIKVPCRKCPVCDNNKAREWEIRLTEEMKQALSCWFVTLTYNDKNLPFAHGLISTLNPKHLQLFNKHLRQKESRYRKKYNVNSRPLRFYGIGEYGLKIEFTHRPHYHILYFNLSEPMAMEIKKIWKKGNVEVAPATPGRIHYVTQYFINRHHPENDIREPPFTRMSTKPGIGNTYIQRASTFHQQNEQPYMEKGNFKFKLPEYYSSRIFSDEEKQKMRDNYKEEATKKHLKKFDRHKDITAYELSEKQQKFKTLIKQSKGKL